VANVGVRSRRALTPFGGSETFILTTTGVRSLRARDVSTLPFVEDVGLRIDEHLTAYMRTLDEATVREAIGVVEPRDGRYFLIIGQRVYVFSYFPKPTKVSAWSYFELPYAITDAVRTDTQLYLRSEDTLFLYGGEDGQRFPDANELPLVLETAFYGGDSAAAQKSWQGFDLSSEGEWKVEARHTETQEYRLFGTAAGDTFDGERFSLGTKGGQLALRLTSCSDGKAVLSQIILHHEVSRAR
jgi:hypothetical protein